MNPGSPSRRRALEALRPGNAGVVYALVILVATLTFVTALQGKPSYVDPTNVANVLDQASLYAILAVFTTIVLISGNFDLSIGSSAALSAAICLKLIDGEGIAVAVVAALASGVAFGLLNGLLVQYVGINAFIVTLATLTAGRGLVLILTNARTISPNSTALFGLMNGTWAVNVGVVAGIVAFLAAGGIALTRGPRAAWASAAGAGVVLVVAGLLGRWNWALEHAVYYMFVVALIVAAVLRFTIVGRRLYATGGNADAARLSGIAVDRYKVVPFVLNGLAAACVGVLFAAQLGAVNPDALQGAELTVLAAAILGGTSLFGGAGSVEKSVVGALILFVLANGFNVLNLGANYQGVIQGMVVLAAAATYTLASKNPGRSRRRRYDATVETSASSGAGGPVGAVPARQLSSDGA